MCAVLQLVPRNSELCEALTDDVRDFFTKSSTQGRAVISQVIFCEPTSLISSLVLILLAEYAGDVRSGSCATGLQ